MKLMEITTPRLRMVSAVADGSLLRSMVGWLNDPIVVRYSEQRHFRHTVASQCLYVDMFSGEDYLLVIYHDTHVPIGTVSIFTDEPNKVANIGIMIGERSMWGKGLGNEAWKAACDRIIYSGRYRKVEAGCMACNVSMMCICSHYGMMEEGRQEDHFLINGQPTDLVHWGKFK